MYIWLSQVWCTYLKMLIQLIYQTGKKLICILLLTDVQLLVPHFKNLRIWQECIQRIKNICWRIVWTPFIPSCYGLTIFPLSCNGLHPKHELTPFASSDVVDPLSSSSILFFCSLDNQLIGQLCFYYLILRSQKIQVFKSLPMQGWRRLTAEIPIKFLSSRTRWD